MPTVRDSVTVLCRRVAWKQVQQLVIDLCLGKKTPLLPPIPNAQGKIDNAAMKTLTGKWPEIKIPGAWKGAGSGKKRKNKGGGKG